MAFCGPYDKIKEIMDRYKILPHTADGKFQAYGTTLEEAFKNAALATASLMWDWAQVESRNSFIVRVRARNLEQLLVKFLTEIIYLLETKRFLLADITALTIDQEEGSCQAEAIFHGEVLSERHEIHGSVKAVTHNEMKIESVDRSGYVIQVVVDM